VAYTLVTGMPLHEKYLDNVLASPQAVLLSEKFEHFDANFTGTGDTLSAALAALLAGGLDLQSATSEALNYLDQCLDAAFAPGMGHLVPDRLFWAQPQEPDEDGEGGEQTHRSCPSATGAGPVQGIRGDRSREGGQPGIVRRAGNPTVASGTPLA
jgi:hydroxymethylpyrimidine/phosphomethylpyrimidine kinase